MCCCSTWLFNLLLLLLANVRWVINAKICMDHFIYLFCCLNVEWSLTVRFSLMMFWKVFTQVQTPYRTTFLLHHHRTIWHEWKLINTPERYRTLGKIVFRQFYITFVMHYWCWTDQFMVRSRVFCSDDLSHPRDCVIKQPNPMTHHLSIYLYLIIRRAKKIYLPSLLVFHLSS